MLCSKMLANLVVTLLAYFYLINAQQISQLPDGYLCYLSRINDCLEKVPSLPQEWNITDPMSYCKDQTRPRDAITHELCSFDDPNCAEPCPVQPLHFQNIFDADDGPQESVIVRRVMDRRYSFPVFLVKWLPLEGANFYVVQQWSDQISAPYYYETRLSFVTVPSWGSCTRNYIRVASVIDSRLHFFSAPAVIFDEPRFPHETPSRFDFLDATLSNDTVSTDFLPSPDERVIYVRVAFRLGITTTTYDISQIGEATMFSPNCRLDFISLYPRPAKLPGAKEFLFTFPESYAARNCTIAVKVHNVVTRCNQTISISTTDQQQQPTSAISRARQRLGIVPPPFLIDRLQAMRQLKIRLGCDTVKNYDCKRAAELCEYWPLNWTTSRQKTRFLVKPACGVTSVDVLPDPEPGTYWLLWGALLHPKNLPIKSWVVLAHHVHNNDTRRFMMPTSDNAPADYGNEFRSDRRLKLEFGASRVTYRIQVCAIYDHKFDESTVDLPTIPERTIQLFDEISEGVSRPRPSPVLAIEPSDEGAMLSEVAVTRMEIVRRALSDRMIVALAVGVALAVSIAICVPFVLCNAIRKRRQLAVNAKLAGIMPAGGECKESNGRMMTIKLSPMPMAKLDEVKY